MAIAIEEISPKNQVRTYKKIHYCYSYHNSYVESHVSIIMLSSHAPRPMVHSAMAHSNSKLETRYPTLPEIQKRI